MRRYKPTLLKILGQLLGQSRLFSKKLGCIDSDLLGLGEICVDKTQFF